MERNKISGGIYLVINPSMRRIELLNRLEEVLQAGVAIVQIWDNWEPLINRQDVIMEVCNLCHRHHVPVLINNSWELLSSFPLDGVHFDAIPDDYAQIQQYIKQDYLVGITCNNDLSLVDWADKNKLDYISFCSIFPSSTSTSCELVSFDKIQEARRMTSLPLFLAGGIQLSNMSLLNELDYDGVAIISGIMSSENPAQVTKQYLETLRNKNNENRNN